MNFSKNKGSKADLKPWQSKEGETVTQSAKRCWDGLYGCEEYKKFEEYRWHPHICQKCLMALCNRYNFEQKYSDFLIWFLWQESNLLKSSRFCGGNVDKINALERTSEQRIRGLWEKINAIGPFLDKIRDANMNYRDWFYKEVGLKFEKGSKADGFLSVADSV